MERIKVSIGLQTVQLNEIRGPHDETSHVFRRPITDEDVVRRILDVIERSPQVQTLDYTTRKFFLISIKEILTTWGSTNALPELLPNENRRTTIMGIGQPFVAHRPPRGITVNGRHPFGREVETPHRPFLAGNAPHTMMTDAVNAAPEEEREGWEMNGIRRYLRSVLPEAIMRRLDEEGQEIITGEGQPVATDADGNPIQGLMMQIGVDFAEAGQDRTVYVLMIQGRPAVVQWDVLHVVQEWADQHIHDAISDGGREPTFGDRLELRSGYNGSLMASGIIVPLAIEENGNNFEIVSPITPLSAEATGNVFLGLVETADGSGFRMPNRDLRIGELPAEAMPDVMVRLLDADGNPVGGPVPGTMETAADTVEDEVAADPNLPPVAMNEDGELIECVFCNKKPARVWAEGFAPECDECASHWETPNDED